MRSWKDWFRFLGDSLRTRFRWLADSSSGTCAIFRVSSRLRGCLGACPQSVGGRGEAAGPCRGWAWPGSGTGRCWRSWTGARVWPWSRAGMGWR